MCTFEPRQPSAPSRTGSAVGVLPIANRADLDDGRLVIDVVDDPIVAHAHPPEIARAPQLLAPRRTRGRGQLIELPRHSGEHGIG